MKGKWNEKNNDVFMYLPRFIHALGTFRRPMFIFCLTHWSHRSTELEWCPYRHALCVVLLDLARGSKPESTCIGQPKSCGAMKSFANELAAILSPETDGVLCLLLTASCH